MPVSRPVLASPVARQVIKLGSSSIASRDGLALDVIAGLVAQIAAAQRAGHEIILVTSGAARLGRRLLSFEERERGAAPAVLTRGGELPKPPAVDFAFPAAVGQPALMALYRQLATAVGVEVCQILVSRSDLASARAMGDLGQLLREAAGRGLLPIVNGNDATDPVSALDNDQVAVAVAVASEASRLLFLTDVRAAYRDATLSEPISRLTPAEARAVRVTSTGSGRGGMGSKLAAAARAACCGVECIIGSAREHDVVGRSLNPRARIGTVVRGAASTLEPARRWIGGIAYSEGTIGVNREAEASLRAGSTLFLSGVKRVDGEFAAGSVVELADVRHPEQVLGRGSVALPSALLRLLRALSPVQVASVISALLRLRYSGADATGALLDPEAYKDCRELARGESRASHEAFAQLTAFSPERVTDLADSLLLTQPGLCATFLLDKGFLHGQIPTDAAARRVVRGIHAVHRESLVVYPD
jgi:glutamate 5-kinase